jgi:hypothetical protein
VTDEQPRTRHIPIPEGDLRPVKPEDEPLTAEEQKQIEKLGKMNVRSAVSLAVAGAPYSEIARVLGYRSDAHAKAAVERALAVAHGDQDAKALRNLANAQLDAMVRTIAPLALSTVKKAQVRNPKTGEYATQTVDNDDLFTAQRQMLSILDRKFKLNGIDAPTQITIVDPKAEEFSKVLELMATQAGLQPAEEGDIFDMEPDEDGTFVEVEHDAEGE